jgi:hypothetical protein
VDAGRTHLDAIVEVLVRAGNDVETGWTRDDVGTWSLALADPIDFATLDRLGKKRTYRTVVFDTDRDLISCAHCWSQILGPKARHEPPERWDPRNESWAEYRARR